MFEYILECFVIVGVDQIQDCDIHMSVYFEKSIIADQIKEKKVKLISVKIMDKC